jgi:Glycosyl transferase family 2
LVPPFDGDPRLALVTVNFSTTKYLKLMLCTLAEQRDLWLLQQIVIVDNASHDGGVRFLRELADRVPRLHLVERRHTLRHANGMRAGVRALEALERTITPDERVNAVLFCDTDVVFRNPGTLLELAAAITSDGVAFVGEARRAYPSAHPDVHASFFVVRRDALERRDVCPPVHDGSPAAAMQASLIRAGLGIIDFPSNQGGFILHRGRAGVDAAAVYKVGAHQRVPRGRESPHFMNVLHGAEIWGEMETRWEPFLDGTNEGALLDHLVDRFRVLSRDAPPIES